MTAQNCVVLYSAEFSALLNCDSSPISWGN
nr:MAG TPA: Picornavirus 2B protein [Caudoviricetes sp.]